MRVIYFCYGNFINSIIVKYLLFWSWYFFDTFWPKVQSKIMADVYCEKSTLIVAVFMTIGKSKLEDVGKVAGGVQLVQPFGDFSSSISAIGGETFSAIIKAFFEEFTLEINHHNKMLASMVSSTISKKN